MIKLATINNALKSIGAVEVLVKGEDYFYFVGDNTTNWKQTAVYVSRLNDLSLEQWIEEYKTLKEGN